MRRWTAAALLVGGLLALAAGALVRQPPLAASLSLARKFWAANTVTRTLNSPLFASRRELGLALLRADAALPLGVDVALSLPAGTAAQAAEEDRRRAAYLLAPRRVLLAGEPSDPQPFALRTVPRAGR